MHNHYDNDHILTSISVLPLGANHNANGDFNLELCFSLLSSKFLNSEVPEFHGLTLKLFFCKYYCHMH